MKRVSWEDFRMHLKKNKLRFLSNGKTIVKACFHQEACFNTKVKLKDLCTGCVLTKKYPTVVATDFNSIMSSGISSNV